MCSVWRSVLGIITDVNRHTRMKAIGEKITYLMLHAIPVLNRHYRVCIHTEAREVKENWS